MANFFGDTPGITSAQNAITGFTGAAADLLTAQGYGAEATAYGQAATLAEQNKQLQAASTALQIEQTKRQVALSIGSTKAEIGAAGLEETGSAADVIRTSASQGALQTQLLEEQGVIQQNAYEQQAQAYVGEQKQAEAAQSAAKAGAAGSAIKGVLGVVGTIAKIFGI